MNTAAPTLCLPLLHPETQDARPPFPENAPLRHIWPGLPDMPKNFWQPSSYPFNPREAAVCLADFQSMSEAALSGVPLQALAKQENAADEVARRDEQESLARFAHTGHSEECSRENNVHILRCAQKSLLWAWLLEERHREVRSLTQGYRDDAGHLVDALGVETDQDWQTISGVQTLLADSDIPLPPWRMVVENAALFLPDECTLIVNHGGMADFLRENAALAPLSASIAEKLALSKELGTALHAVEARVALHFFSKDAERHRQSRPWLNKTVTCVLVEGWI